MTGIVNIRLKSIGDVKQFVQDIQKAPFDVYISNDIYVVDAKSIMGVLSLNFNKTLTLGMELPTEFEKEQLKEIVKNYII